MQGTLKVKVAHYLVFIFSSPKISLKINLLSVFYLPSNKQIIGFDFEKQNTYTPWF